MENEIAVYAVGYVALRLGVLAIFGFFLYRMATLGRAIKLSEETVRADYRPNQQYEARW